MPNIASPARTHCPWPLLATAAGCLLALAVALFVLPAATYTVRCSTRVLRRLAVALFVLPAATYTAKVPHDILGYFDVMHRLSMGQQPHADYHTPIGWLAYGLPWLGHLALGQFGGALEFGCAAMLAILLPLAALALHGRVPAGPSLLLLFALFAVVAVPWPLSESGLASTQVAHYNRWGWALLTTLLLLGLPTGAGEREARHPLAWAAAESAAIAALLSLLFFLKATYFAVGLVFVLLFGVALGRFRRTGAWGLAAFLLATGRGWQWIFLLPAFSLHHRH